MVVVVVRFDIPASWSTILRLELLDLLVEDDEVLVFPRPLGDEDRMRAGDTLR